MYYLSNYQIFGTFLCENQYLYNQRIIEKYLEEWDKNETKMG